LQKIAIHLKLGVYNKRIEKRSLVIDISRIQNEYNQSTSMSVSWSHQPDTS